MRKILALAATSLLTWNSLAQQSTEQISFEDAVKIALHNSVLLNQQKNNLEAVQAQRLSNIAGFGPTLSAQITAAEQNGNNFNQQQGKVINGIFDQVSGSVNANLNLFSGFSQIYRVKQSANLMEAQAFYINRTAQDVINSISLAYLQVLVDEELLKIAEENAVALDKQLEQTIEQVKVGAKSLVDQYNQDSQAKGAKVRALQAKINLINDKATLTQILLIDPSEDFRTVKPDWSGKFLTLDSVNYNVLLETALQHRGDFLRAKRNEEAARFGMKVTRTSMMPSLNAFGQLYTSYNKAIGDPNTRPFSDQVSNDNIRKIYGVQLSIPILGGNQIFQNRSNYVQQRVNYDNSIQIRKGVESQIKTDIMRAYQNLRLYAETFAVSTEQLFAAKQAYQYETERYNLGVSSFVDFVNANKTYVQAQTDLAQAEYRFLFQKILTEYATGTLKIEDFQ